MAFALGQYLKKNCLMSFAWAKTGGHQLKAPEVWPALTKPMILNKAVQYTYYENVVTVSYSQWNWDWDRWSREIDWMALTGVNLCLAFTGQEEIYRKVYTGLGLNDTQLQHFFDGPAFLAWSRGQGMSGVGGPLPRKFMAEQWALNKKIVSRQKELGIGSILPQFQGNVPVPMVKLFPGANISVQSGASSGWLDGLDPLFERMSDLVLTTLIEDFGMTGFYEADGFFNHDTGPWYEKTHPSRRFSKDEKKKQQQKRKSSSAAAPASATQVTTTAPPPDPQAFARAARVYSLMIKHDPNVS
jgi:alpha-N-acetylglucosaminidase